VIAPQVPPGEVDGLVPHEAHLGALAALPYLGATSLRTLLAEGTPAEVWERVRRGRLGVAVTARLPPAVRAAAAEWPTAAQQIDPEAMWRRWRRAGIGVVSLGSPGYPECLSGDPEPPVVLFHRGDPDVLARPRVAIIGTRRATAYGRRIAFELGRDLATAGVCVVSGLALGIDAAAHRGAVATDGVGPAAVVGGGVDAPGPATNAELARDVVDRGVVLSEVPPGTPPAPWRFPVRNRILAGLAQVVVVVESAAAGGSMLTVEQAQLRDRAVLAVPGPVDSVASDGTNRLLSEGAGVCTNAEDVLMALGFEADVAGFGAGASTEVRTRPTGDAAAVLEVLGFAPVPVEALAREVGLDLTRLSVALGDLERLGWAERRGPFVERVARGRVDGSLAARR